jgi:hypothetical protein
MLKNNTPHQLEIESRYISWEVASLQRNYSMFCIRISIFFDFLAVWDNPNNNQT